MTDKELEKLLVPELETMGFECVKLEVVGSPRHPVVRQRHDLVHELLA